MIIGSAPLKQIGGRPPTEKTLRPQLWRKWKWKWKWEWEGKGAERGERGEGGEGGEKGERGRKLKSKVTFSWSVF